MQPFHRDVGIIDAALLDYFEEYWFKCKDQWSNVGRS